MYLPGVAETGEFVPETLHFPDPCSLARSAAPTGGATAGGGPELAAGPRRRGAGRDAGRRGPAGGATEAHGARGPASSELPIA